MATSHQETSRQAGAQVRAYVRRLLGSNEQAGAQRGTSSAKLPLPRGASTSRISETPHALSRQLDATSYTTTSKKSGGGGSGIGNIWTISPLASTVKSLFNLFSGGASSSQSTRYRTRSRAPFHIVESVSPESGSGVKSLNESAAGLTGVMSSLGTGGAGSGNNAGAGAISSRGVGSGLSTNERLALVTAMRRSLNESQGFTDVLSEFQDGL